MIRRFAIDTSILVRLLTHDPQATFARCVNTLRILTEKEGTAIVASNQVIGEAYVAVQHHYGVSKAQARAGLRDVMDRLIADDYARVSLEVLTLDRKMAALPGVRRL